ncbi:unnamed protein product [Caenorhabditis brenneri]
MNLPILQDFLFKNALPEEEIVDDPKAELDEKKLWEEFSEFGTEMVITKIGRRMFPTTRLRFSGLHFKSKYIVMMELIPTDKSRYKFCNGSWQVSGAGDFEPIRAPFVHPDSPQTGAHWMTMGASFKPVKLSNNPMNQGEGYFFLNSMHRYQPRFHIVRCDQFNKAIVSTFRTFVFKHTDFMAVTAYQNQDVTKKKIANNPFAKGFRNRNDEEDRPVKRRHREVKKKKEKTPPASEDEEPEAKKRKIIENIPLIPSQNIPLAQTPKIPLDLLTQWQMAIISSFGNLLPISDPAKIKNDSDIPLKKGFDVVDLLGEKS